MIAVSQMTATSDKEHNFNICKNLIEEASQLGAKVIFIVYNFIHQYV